ncbi:MAG: hypothetical protein E7812_11235 [Phenylobacterium sp.]|nr:MAG: hypothetical protein E7812_11235 [Phenylobacterium sp.]
MRRLIALLLGTALCAIAGSRAATAPAKSPVAATDPNIPQPGWSPPRNAWGQPDLSGYWSNATLTPLTRDVRLVDRATLTPAEAKARETVFAEGLAARDAESDPNSLPGNADDKAKDAKLIAARPDFGAAGGDVGGYNTFWLDPGTHLLDIDGQYRTAIVTTPNGQVPPRKDGQRVGGFGPGPSRDSYDSYENRPLSERCIAFGRNAPPPMLPNGYYNNNYNIVQTADAVAIQVEHIHDVRIIRLGDHHRTDGVRPWLGDSVGHYEGATLVVETTNLPQAQGFMGSWKSLKVTEWFTRISPTRINYRFQVEDADAWDRPWGGEYNFSPLHGIVYEYACHEGNYALPAILAGARRQEQDAATAAPAASIKPRSGAD